MKSSESQFIKQIRQMFHNNSNTEKGIGDDCAVIPFSDKEVYLITTDALVEEVHFTLKTTSFKTLGRKSIAVNLSDIAAMGGNPKYIFISISIPKNVSEYDIIDFYDGVKEISSEYNISLLGGDTTSSLNHMFISVTAIGVCKSDKILYRSGAQPGNFIYVTGTLGDSSVGLSLLSVEHHSISTSSDSIIRQRLIEKHLLPTPRVKEMNYLNSHYKIHSAIDISDGLSTDLSHIIGESNVGAEIEWNKIPISKELKKTIQKENIESHVLHGGEEYEILFTSPDNINVNEFYKRTNTRLSRVGKITTSQDVYLLRDSERKLLLPQGFDHFMK